MKQTILIICCIALVSTVHAADHDMTESKGRGAAPVSLAKLMIDCHNALINARVIEGPTKLREDGTFYMESFAGLFLFVKDKERYLTYSVPTTKLDGTRANVASIPGGGKLLISKNPFASQQTIIRFAAEDSTIPKDIEELDIDLVGALDPQSTQPAADGGLYQLINGSLAVPLGGAYGPPPEYFKKNKEKIAVAAEACRPAAKAVGGEFQQTSQVIDYVLEAIEKL